MNANRVKANFYPREQDPPKYPSPPPGSPPGVFHPFFSRRGPVGRVLRDRGVPRESLAFSRRGPGCRVLSRSLPVARVCVPDEDGLGACGRSTA